MRAPMIVVLSTLSLVLCATAHAEETARPAPRGNVVTVERTIVNGRVQRPHVTIDINRLVPRAPLPELKKPLLDRIAAAAEKDPF